ncbi:MAG: nitrate reductase cytochrome c-type subunit [Gammaproteobacteria bacterium SHHR-1]|uniref:nitrate reductase cytochrome c-type subunit n=1 Tax=Magnetovirga frankeli TaxID=947516 RepID=UPI0012939CE5|nr:nitrate reductase cytochrome c-type subunit [gamma proteobacterium SS-5]
MKNRSVSTSKNAPTGAATRRYLKGLFLVLLLGLLSQPLAALESLRGQVDLQQNNPVFGKRNPASMGGGFGRSYELQPPMIPHNIEKESISLRGNSCMRCHAPENFQREKAPALSETHFMDRQGNKLTRIASRRYFCTQCHAPQVNAPPLVENLFQGNR